MKTLRVCLATTLLVALVPAISVAGISINGGGATVDASSSEQVGSFEVFLQSDLGAAPDLNDWQLVLDSLDSRITLTGGNTTSERPYVLDGIGSFFGTKVSNSGSRLKALDSGFLDSAPADDGDGLLSVNFAVAPNTPVGQYEIAFSMLTNDTFLSNTGGDIDVTSAQSAVITIVPEPSTMVMSILGICGLVTIVARRRRAW